ncbi:CP [Garlic common virus]|nr:CP [Garlic common virus]QED43078.1 CP [Garlic common virus]QED43083.1 CP [Garlic common virus]QED43088.1 CP [Garlic common virus]
MPETDEEKNTRLAKEAASRVRERNDRLKSKEKSSLLFSPSLDDLKSASYEPAPSSIATEEELATILSKWTELKLPRDKAAIVAWDLARHCADNGSTESTMLSGMVEGIERKQLVAAIRQVCTLRQFCGKFAKIVWNMMIISKIPPSNYAKNGHKEDTKFSAFDFFDAVLSPAAIEPEGGLVREPTNAERVAAAASKRIKIHNSMAAKGTDASTLTEITGGRAGPKSELITLKRSGGK